MSDLEKRLNQIEQKIDAAVNIPSPYYGANVQQNTNDEIDLRELWNVLWAGKWWIIGITFLFAVVGVFYALSLPNMYKSEGVYAPTQKENSSGGLASQYGGLAAIAGINLGGEGNDRIDQAITLLVSWPFLDSVIVKHKLKPELRASKDWNYKSGKVIWDKSLYNPEKQQWLFSSDGESKEPTSYDTFKTVKKYFDVEKDSKTGLITVSFVHVNPEFSKRIVDVVISDLNDYFRQKDIIRSEDRIEYLEKRISSTSITEMQSVFYEMIDAQLKTLMLAKVEDEYLIQNVVKTKIAEERSSPNRILVVILFMFIGGVLGACVVVILGLRKKR